MQLYRWPIWWQSCTLGTCHPWCWNSLWIQILPLILQVLPTVCILTKTTLSTEGELGLIRGYGAHSATEGALCGNLHLVRLSRFEITDVFWNVYLYPFLFCLTWKVLRRRLGWKWLTQKHLSWKQLQSNHKEHSSCLLLCKRQGEK